MVKRAPIIAAGNPLGTEEGFPFNDDFVFDRGKVWDLIYPIIVKTEAWPRIERARTIRDGRKAMMVFYDHFLGPNNVDCIQKQAEQKIFSLSYQGERKNWNFGRFVTAHKEQHNIM